MLRKWIGVSGLAIGAWWAAAPAQAACVQSGSSVTCSGTTTTPFDAGTADGLTVTNQSGATMTINGAMVGVLVNNNSAIINDGTMSFGDGVIGMLAGANSALTNNGTISLGANAIAMFKIGTGGTFVNKGSISSTSGFAIGIDVSLGGSSTVINSGTMTLTGVGNIGIGALSDNNTIVNSGTITIGNGSVGTNGDGIWIQSNNSVTNNGTINAVGTSSIGISISGDGNTITNNGKIIGDPAIAVSGYDNTVINNGLIATAPTAYNAIFSFGTSGFTLVNNGTIDGPISVGGPGSTFTNAGLITTTGANIPIGSGQYFGGTFTQTATGTLALRVNTAGAHDVFTAETVNLGGKLRALLQPGLFGAPVTYTGVVTATDPINGKFAEVTTSSAFVGATAIYNTTSVDVTLTRYGFGAVPGETKNQRAVGNVLEPGYSTSLTGPTAAFYSNLLQAQSLTALDQLSGEGTSGTQNTAFLANGLFVGTMAQQMDSWRTGGRVGFTESPVALGYAAEKPVFKAARAAYDVPSWRGWGTGFGATQSLKGDASTGSANLSDRAFGGAVGLDVQLNPSLLVGLGVGGSTARFDVSDRATSGKLDGQHVGAYAMQRWGGAYAAAIVSYAHFDNSTSRTISGIGATETAQGSFSSNQLGAKLEIGNTWTYAAINVTPFAALQVSQLWQDGYGETSTTVGGGPGILGLTYGAQRVQSLPASLGAQVDSKVDLGSGIIWSPYLRAAWVHEFSPARTINAAFNSLAAAPFAIDGARAASNAAKLDVGSALAINPNAALFSAFNGEFSGAGQTYAATGGLRISW